MRYSFLFTVLIVCALQGIAQTTTEIQRDIIGTIWEMPSGDEKGMSLPGANVLLLNARDSSLVTAMAVGADGKFLFSEIKQGNYVLSVSFISYETKNVSISEQRFRANRTIDLGKIVMVESSISLQDLTITGQIPEMVVKEDTIEYNPAAYKMQDGAIVEDLLKRLPGVEVETDGNITAGGRQVRRVFVNGKEFFGNDPKMATQNLTVDMIDKVQVIEKPLDEAILTGVDDGETETVINLTIKKNMNKGWMGNVNAGIGVLVNNITGEDPRYTANGRLMKFTENSQTTFIVNANNINQRGGSFGGCGGGGGGFGGGGNSGGITNSNTFGVNSSTIVNDKFKIGGNVRYNYSETYSISKSFRTNLLIDSVSYRNSESERKNNSHNLLLNGKMEYKPDSTYTIVFEPRFSYNLSNSDNYSSQETLAGDENYSPVNESTSRSTMKSNGMELSGELTLTRNFERKGRRLSLTLNGNLNQTTGNGTNLSQSLFHLQPNRNRDLNQESNTTTNTNSYRVRISYVEPLTDNIRLQMFYNYSQNGTLNIRETFDFDGNAFSTLNTDYSKSLDNNFVNQTMGISLNATYSKHIWNIGANIVPSYTQSTSFVKNGISEGVDSVLNNIKGRKVVNYAPQISYRYRFNQQTNLRFSYRGNTRQPSVSQLDPTADVTNPLNIRSGNPELLPTFTNSMSLRFNANQREAQRALTASIDYNFSINDIINYTEYEEGTGIQYTTPKNENGSWSSSGNITYSSPIANSKKLKFSTTTRIDYRNNVGYIIVKKASQRNITMTTNISENIGISYTNAWFYGQLRGNLRYSNSTYSHEDRDGRKDFNFGINYNTQLTLPLNFGISSDVNYRAQRGLSEGYNKDEILWNAGISKQFMKGNRASLRLEWTDILKQRLSISRSVSANYIEDSEFNALTSYVLLSFTYRFNNMTRIRGESNDVDRMPRGERPEGEMNFQRSRGDGQSRERF